MKAGLATSYLAVGLTLSLVAGCGGVREAASVKTVPSVTRDREKAIQHFVEGSLFDQKEDYAKAILEYQDALQYDEDPAIYHAISRDYSLIGKHALAAQMGRQAVKLAPWNRVYRENLAGVYLNAFEFDKAIAEYEEVVRMDSEYIDGYYHLARLYQMQKPIKALELYQAILDRFGPTWEVYVQLVSLYNSTGKFEEAAAAVRSMLALDPGSYELKRTLADTYLRAGKKDDALHVYEDLLERNPNDLEVRAAIAHVYLLQQRYELATDQLRSVLRSDTLSVETQLRFGEYFASFLQKDSTAAPYAFEVFKRIQENYPDDWRPYWFLGVIASVMKRDSVASTNLRRVTELAPTNPDGWVYLASLYFERNDFQRAAEVLEQAKKILPEAARVHFLLGLSFQRLKRTEDAARVLERARLLNPKDVNTLSALALVYDEMKRHEDSDRLYEDALKLDPHNHLILNNYGYSMAERGEHLERALAMAKEAVQQQPENPSYLDTMGWVYFKLGQHEEAERFVRKAVEKGEASAVVHEHLGDIYSKLGQKDKALEYWQKALDKDSTNQVLKAKISRGGL